MSIFNKNYNRKETETTFHLKANNKIVGRLGVKLSKDDWEQVQALIASAYNAGFSDGGNDKAAEIRNALGLGVKS